MDDFRQNSVFHFLEAVFRGAGNVVVQSNALTGLLVVIGIAVGNWSAAVNFVIGAAMATLVAIWFGADRRAVDAGMFAFGGGYVGMMSGAFLAQQVPFVSIEWMLVLVLGSILAVPVTSSLSLAFGKLGIPATAMPVLVLIWAILAGALYTGLPANSVAPMVLPANPQDAAPYTWQTFLYSILNGLGQIVGQANPITGTLMLAGILINSRIGGLMAVVGGLVPVLMGWVLGYDEATLSSGTLSLNSILTMMALGGFFIYLGWRSFLYALLGSIFALWAFLGLAALLNPLGLPALTIGFVVVVALLLLGAQTYGFVRPVPLHKITKPEDHLKHQQAGQTKPN